MFEQVYSKTGIRAIVGSGFLWAWFDALYMSSLFPRADDSGLLAVGMRADLCVLNTDTPQFTPMTSAACNVVYAAQGADIRMTMVDGEVLYRDGEFKTIDIEKVKAEVQRRTDSILSRL